MITNFEKNIPYGISQPVKIRIKLMLQQKSPQQQRLENENPQVIP